MMDSKVGVPVLIIICSLFFLGSCFQVKLALSEGQVQHGSNITQEMVQGIQSSIAETSHKCDSTDQSCFAQVVGMKVQALYGKSWNVHLVGKNVSRIAGATFSKDRWISLRNEGNQNFTYFIFKPIDCSKPFFTIQELLEKKSTGIRGAEEHWGNKVTEGMKERIRKLIMESYQLFPNDPKKNADYLQSKMSPGRWQIIVWDIKSFDYINTCVYESYFGLILGVMPFEWSYYFGRMSLL